MKVAHVLRKYNPAEWGGTETALLGLCEGLRRSGVHSVVFAPRIPAGEPERDPLAEVGCEVRRFEACVPIWGLTAERRRQMISVGGNLMSFGLIRALWREPGLTVIHAHTMGRIGSIGRAVARWRGLPFLFTTHGGVYDLPEALNRTLHTPEARGWEWGKACGLLLQTRGLLAGADAIITCNEREAGLMRAHHPDRRVVVQPHGVPAALYARDQRATAAAAYPALAGRRVLLAIGRIDAVKNQLWLVEQLPRVLRQRPDVLLVLAGAVTDYRYGDALVARIRALGLERQVLLAGGLPPGDARLIGLVQTAEAVVLPSVAETFGLVILEAWAAGTPVISSRTSGAQSLIEHEATGLLFDVAEPDAFHAALTTLWTDAATVMRMVDGGRRRVLADFETRVLADRMRRLYEELGATGPALRHPA